MRLTQIEDIAGLRVVVKMTRDTQDELVQRIMAALPEGPKLKDRRVHPSHGYRAVHVVARVAGHQVEIQVRTRLQDLWAQMVERLADSWGRQIRYGRPPDHPATEIADELTRADVVQLLLRISESIDGLETWERSVEKRDRDLVQLSRVGQDRIDELMGEETIDLAVLQTDVVQERQEVDERMVEIRSLLKELDLILQGIETGTIEG
jgi:hypothetical protein